MSPFWLRANDRQHLTTPVCAAIAASGPVAAQWSVAPRLQECVDEQSDLAYAKEILDPHYLLQGRDGVAGDGRLADRFDQYDRALEYAKIVGVPLVHPMAGVPAEGEATRARDVYLENIRYAFERTWGEHQGAAEELISVDLRLPTS